MLRCRYPIQALLPHESPMILLDDVVAYDAKSLHARVTITRASLFLGPEGVPAHIGIEYMAQACGAYAGAQARDANQPVRVGFLLGTRRYECRVPYFRVGDQLAVSAAATYKDDEMGSFDCRIEIEGALVAAAQLTVYQPPDVGGTMQERLSGA